MALCKFRSATLRFRKVKPAHLGVGMSSAARNYSPLEQRPAIVSARKARATTDSTVILAVTTPSPFRCSNLVRPRMPVAGP
ncbi:hypothetical protein CBOM_08047 [Ceraceosorus bombacis]|uniref:Uncharacterized protein n=1 Tax=Ceraceosorus bombacis TaxID=401625 RepID=A0A0P1BLD0_9BASI|nr:hypothetical protein CBOM_08047 [Ceraceosorus bombacis]